MRRGWTVRDSLELYNVANWGDGFFDVNREGRIEVRPRRDEGTGIDLLELVQNLRRRGLRTPMLIRWPRKKPGWLWRKPGWPWKKPG